MRETTTRRSTAPVIGIVGGLAAGKSTVAEMLRRRGAAVVDADGIGHRQLASPVVKARLTEAFGRGILDEGGEVDRPRLAETVFGDSELTRKLNDIVHPPILERIRSRIRQLRRDDRAPLIALDAALLVETDLHTELCDALLFVEAPERLRRERALTGRRMDGGQFEKRTHAQVPVRQKRRLADFVIRNVGDTGELESQLQALWPDLCAVGSGRRGVSGPPQTGRTPEEADGG